MQHFTALASEIRALKAFRTAWQRQELPVAFRKYELHRRVTGKNACVLGRYANCSWFRVNSQERNMKIDSDYSVGKSVAGRSRGVTDGDDFAKALAQAAGEREVSAKETTKRQKTPEERTAEMRQAHAAQVKELQEFLDKPLAVHLREAVMKKMGVTEEKLAAMSPEQRQAIEAEINRRVREQLLGKKEEGDQPAMDALQQPLQTGQASASPLPGGSAALDALIAQMAMPQAVA